MLVRDWNRMLTFFQFPKDHWKYLRTTNVVESPFAALRLRNGCCQAVQEGGERHRGDLKDAHAGAERRFRRLDAPGKLLEVYLGLGVGEAHKGKEVIQEEVLAVA